VFFVGYMISINAASLVASWAVSPEEWPVINVMHWTPQSAHFLLIISVSIVYVIQQAGLFPHMTVEQNISAVPDLLKWDKAKTQARVTELLTMIGLDPDIYRTRYPRQLSGGEQQRVGLARAMAIDPSVMLMDEPFGAIDAITRAGLQDELKSLQKSLNKTILFVTHDIQEALKLGDRVIIMDQGEVQQYDTPYNILFNPANDYVRRLTKTNNLFDKLKLIAAYEVMEEASESDLAHSVAKEEDLGTVLTYLIMNGIDQAAVVSDTSEVVGRITMDKIWDTVRPALQTGDSDD